MGSVADITFKKELGRGVASDSTPTRVMGFPGLNRPIMQQCSLLEVRCKLLGGNLVFVDLGTSHKLAMDNTFGDKNLVILVLDPCFFFACIKPNKATLKVVHEQCSCGGGPPGDPSFTYFLPLCRHDEK